jgi:hypothetical protein
LKDVLNLDEDVIKVKRDVFCVFAELQKVGGDVKLDSLITGSAGGWE